jgi:hypothetical protein
MAKTHKDKQCYTKHIEERQTIPWPVLAMVLSDVLRCVLYNIVCPCWFWPWYVKQYHGQNQQGETMLYKTHQRTSDNTMAKTSKDKQCYTKQIEERQTIVFVLVGFGNGIV